MQVPIPPIQLPVQDNLNGNNYNSQYLQLPNNQMVN